MGSFARNENENDNDNDNDNEEAHMQHATATAMPRRAGTKGKVPPRVCVVGAGVAGLRCAHVLMRGGIEVTILEGRERIGGRVCTLLCLSCVGVFFFVFGLGLMLFFHTVFIWGNVRGKGKGGRGF